MATNDERIAHDQGRKSALQAEGSIVGYPTEEQKAELIQTAIKLFNETPEAMQNAMIRFNDGLESVKFTHSLRSKKNGMDGSDQRHSTIVSQGSNSEGSMMRRVVSSPGGLVMRKRSSGKSRSSNNLRSLRNSFSSNPISENAPFVENSMRKNETFNLRSTNPIMLSSKGISFPQKY
jgi:hypothetical protein